MTELPSPLVAADVDVGPLDGFMLDTVRLLGSELVALSSGDEFKAAVLLWARAWKQRPAASLPNDERTLASYAGYGNGSRVDLKAFAAVRAMAMRGFVLCSDNRWYHPVLAEDANRAFAALRKRQKWQDDKKRQRSQDGGHAGGQTDGHDQGPDEGHSNKSGADTPVDPPQENGVHRRDGTGRENKKEDSPLPPQPGKSRTERVGDTEPTHIDLYALSTRQDSMPDRVRTEWDIACLQGAEPRKIITAWKAFLALPEVKGRDAAFIPTPERWLKDGGWKVQPKKPNGAHGPEPTERQKLLAAMVRFDGMWRGDADPAKYGRPPDAQEIAVARKAYREHVVAWGDRKIAWNAALWGERKPDDAEVRVARKALDEALEIPAHLVRTKAGDGDATATAGVTHGQG